MIALKIQRAIVAGFDWGARTADIVAALRPERCKALVSVSGYLIGSQAANQKPLPPNAELQWWYQFYFATDRGRAGYEQYAHHLIPGGVGHTLPQEARRPSRTRSSKATLSRQTA